MEWIATTETEVMLVVYFELKAMSPGFLISILLAKKKAKKKSSINCRSTLVIHLKNSITHVSTEIGKFLMFLKHQMISFILQVYLQIL